MIERRDAADVKIYPGRDGSDGLRCDRAGPSQFSKLCDRVCDGRCFPALNRYALEPTPNIVLVGSMKAFRLYEGYFQTRLRNIWISGRPALTGVAILTSYPHVVLVETDVRPSPSILSSAKIRGPLSRAVHQQISDKWGVGTSYLRSRRLQRYRMKYVETNS